MSRRRKVHDKRSKDVDERVEDGHDFEVVECTPTKGQAGEN